MATMGVEVYTVGYPLTDESQDPTSRERRWVLHARYLRGFTTRAFDYPHHRFGEITSWEIDMPAPEGISGAPLIEVGASTVLGVICGVNEVQRIAEYATDDPVTGERRPEVLRIERFALATHTDTFRNLAGEATDSHPLHQLVAYGMPVDPRPSSGGPPRDSAAGR